MTPPVPLVALTFSEIIGMVHSALIRRMRSPVLKIRCLHSFPRFVQLNTVLQCFHSVSLVHQYLREFSIVAMRVKTKLRLVG